EDKEKKKKKIKEEKSKQKSADKEKIKKEKEETGDALGEEEAETAETESEEEKYTPTIKVVSTSSDLIKAEQQVSFSVSSNILADFKATNHGTLMFPLFEMPLYAIAGLISNFF
ncbi:hypothetical protein HZC08_00785, partial [Candidatus Micrarchaeota archaeon]|nr:hypothetical protein [Candidatus Micrarchaeota archaeon]